jgi:hypothetical protein
MTTLSKNVQGKQYKEENIKWTVLSFPIMNINFNVIEIDGPKHYGLMKVNDVKKNILRCSSNS